MATPTSIPEREVKGTLVPLPNSLHGIQLLHTSHTEKANPHQNGALSLRPIQLLHTSHVERAEPPPQNGVLFLFCTTPIYKSDRKGRPYHNGAHSLHSIQLLHTSQTEKADPSMRMEPFLSPFYAEPLLGKLGEASSVQPK